MEKYELPVGFGMALAQRPKAMEKFVDLSEEKSTKLLVVHIRYLQKKKCNSMWIELCLNTR